LSYKFFLTYGNKKIEKYVIETTQRGMGSRNQIFTETMSRQDFGISAYLEFAEKREIQSDKDQEMNEIFKVAENFG